MAKSKLLSALDRHKGRDFEAEKRQKQVKAAEKRKKQKAKSTEPEAESDDETNSAVGNGESEAAVQQPGTEDFASFSEDEDQQEEDINGTTSTIPQPPQPVDASASEAENESDVPLSDLEDEDLEDTIPHQRLTINNGPALIASRNRVALIKSNKIPFQYHNSLISSLPPTSSAVPDPNDDLTRELEFYRIARDAATEARSLLKKDGIPFFRPSDYFAEMVKTDEHMGRVKKKMYDEAASKKASEEARKLRDAKKFGKAVQVAKEQERAKDKRNTLDKIKELKRKRKGQDTGKVREDGDELFQSVDVEKGPAKDRSGRERGSGPNKRQKKDQKYGFGGKKRFSKSGDAMSSGDMREFSASRMKGKPKRPGKSRRAAGR
ncbi:rRNA-processing protein EBP2 [Elasticomyces elasticus]|nr:rRNA-processing protein EBP2 [Elasticomyces elasticus]KAK5034268.1 rRNA-processing protein EBP2 [Exophiala sideris]